MEVLLYLVKCAVLCGPLIMSTKQFLYGKHALMTIHLTRIKCGKFVPKFQSVCPKGLSLKAGNKDAPQAWCCHLISGVVHNHLSVHLGNTRCEVWQNALGRHTSNPPASRVLKRDDTSNVQRAGLRMLDAGQALLARCIKHWPVCRIESAASPARGALGEIGLSSAYSKKFTGKKKHATFDGGGKNCKADLCQCHKGKIELTFTCDRSSRAVKYLHDTWTHSQHIEAIYVLGWKSYSHSCQALKMISKQGTSEFQDKTLMTLETD